MTVLETGRERPVRVGVVGLGVIGRVHMQVLSRVERVQPVFLVDPRPADSPWPVAHHARLAEALDDCGGEVDLVVVATPTDSHLEVAGEALAGTTATVLSEKPLTRDVAELSRFETTHAAGLDRLRVVNHFAFSPEVEWGAGVVSRAGWGAPTTVFSSFNDPYLAKTPSQRLSYVSSWIDSGANQLSMLARFAEGWRIRRHDEDDGGLRSVTEADFDGGSATLASSWWAGDSSKQTVLRWSTGQELYLDHTAMTGFVLVDGRIREHLGHDGSVDRKTAHYAAMYSALFTELSTELSTGAAGHLLGLPLARTVADLLSSAGSRVTDDGVGPTWSIWDGTLAGWSSAPPTAGTSSSTDVAGGPPTR